MVLRNCLLCRACDECGNGVLSLSQATRQISDELFETCHLLGSGELCASLLLSLELAAETAAACTLRVLAFADEPAQLGGGATHGGGEELGLDGSGGGHGGLRLASELLIGALFKSRNANH